MHRTHSGYVLGFNYVHENEKLRASTYNRYTIVFPRARVKPVPVPSLFLSLKRESYVLRATRVADHQEP